MRCICIIIGLLLCGGGTLKAQSAYEEEVLQRSFLGKPLPDFPVKEWVGKKPKTQGKFVLVDFWAIFAYSVTRHTVPYQNELAEKYKKQFCVIGYTSDPANLVKLVVDPKIRYYSGIVDYEVMEQIFCLTAWPASYLIDPDGIVVWEGAVLDDEGKGLTEERLEQFFRDYEKKKRTKTVRNS